MNDTLIATSIDMALEDLAEGHPASRGIRRLARRT